MDDKFSEILDGLPPKPPRSRLDPHVTLIDAAPRPDLPRDRACARGNLRGQDFAEQHLLFRSASRPRGETIESGTSKAPFPQCPFGACDRRQTGIASESASRRCTTDRGTQES